MRRKSFFQKPASVHERVLLEQALGRVLAGLQYRAVIIVYLNLACFAAVVAFSMSHHAGVIVDTCCSKREIAELEDIHQEFPLDHGG